MVYYPLSTLMLAGIRDIMLISTPEDLPQFRRLLGDGSRFGVRFEYAVQPSPDGIAQAFLIGRDWLEGEACALALGDNLIHADHLSTLLRAAAARPAGATRVRLSGARSGTLWRGRLSMPTGRAVEVVEKPAAPTSNWAITGLYFYDRLSATSRPQIRPSARGELEITDLNRVYLEMGTLHVEKLSRGCAWLDAGTPDSLLQAATFVQTIQSRTGMLVGCPEEVAFRMGFIDADRLRDHATRSGQDRTGPGADGTGRRGTGVKVEAVGDRRRQADHPAAVPRPPRLLLGNLEPAQLRRGRHSGTVRPGQPRGFDLGRACCADCIARSARMRRASWCARSKARSTTWRSMFATARRPSEDVGAELSAENWAQIWVPVGFLHAYCTLTDETEVIYKVTGAYDKAAERGVIWNDPDIGIKWPVAGG